MSIFTKILLATDGSEGAQRAVETATGLSTKLESELYLVYVAREHPYLHAYHDLRHQEEEERFKSEDEQMLGESVKYVRKAGGAVTESYLRVGEAANEIVELAEELGVGLVVLGSNGRGRIRRALMGSVSTSVLRHAHCSVLIARLRSQLRARTSSRQDTRCHRRFRGGFCGSAGSRGDSQGHGLRGAPRLRHAGRALQTPPRA